MQTEIEAKFLNVDHNELRQKLRRAGAKCVQPMRLMRRRNFDHPDGRLEKIGGWVRVRDEGDKITLSYKQLNNRSLHGTMEVNLIIDDFESACHFLESIGLVQKSYQETRRESWEYNESLIELDEWPWIKPFVELECPTEDKIKTAAKQLGLEWSLALHGSVENAYQAEYDLTEAEIDSWPEIKFGPVPKWLEPKRR